MKLLDGSGGSTKGNGIYAFFKEIINLGYTPDIMSGVSFSALILVAISLRKYKELNHLMDNYTLDYIFDDPPINKKGNVKLKAVFKAISGCSGLSKMTPLEDILRNLVTEKDFIEYQSGNYPKCISMAVDFKSGTRVFNNAKTCSYEDYINHTIASACIPVFTEPVNYNGKILFDGGVRNHSIGAWICENYDVTECYSIFSRPEDFKIENTNWKDDNIIDVLSRNTEIRNIELSKMSERDLINILPSAKIGFLPSILRSLYDADRGRLNQLTKAGKQVARNIY